MIERVLGAIFVALTAARLDTQRET